MEFRGLQNSIEFRGLKIESNLGFHGLYGFDVWESNKIHELKNSIFG